MVILTSFDIEVALETSFSVAAVESVGTLLYQLVSLSASNVCRLVHTDTAIAHPTCQTLRLAHLLLIRSA